MESSSSRVGRFLATGSDADRPDKRKPKVLLINTAPLIVPFAHTFIRGIAMKYEILRVRSHFIIRERERESPNERLQS